MERRQSVLKRLYKCFSTETCPVTVIKRRKNLLSELNKKVLLNWSTPWSFLLVTHTPSANLHCSASLPIHHITFIIFHRSWRSLGQRLLTPYGTLLMPEAEADRAAFTTSLTSFQLCSSKPNSIVGSRYAREPHICAFFVYLFLFFFNISILLVR